MTGPYTPVVDWDAVTPPEGVERHPLEWYLERSRQAQAERDAEALHRLLDEHAPQEAR